MERAHQRPVARMLSFRGAEVGKTRQLEFKFQSNTRRSCPALSLITLALQLIQHGMAAFPPRQIGATLERLRYDYPALQF
jgi:hypothetical protein